MSFTRTSALNTLNWVGFLFCACKIIGNLASKHLYIKYTLMKNFNRFWLSKVHFLVLARYLKLLIRALNARDDTFKLYLLRVFNAVRVSFEIKSTNVFCLILKRDEVGLTFHPRNICCNWKTTRNDSVSIKPLSLI